MKKRNLIAFAFAAWSLAAAQESSEAPFDEAAFLKAVQDGLPSDPKGRAMFFAINHEEVAVPILVAEIESKMNDPDADYFIRSAAGLAIYNANQRAVDTVADLCLTDQKRFAWLVDQVLYSAMSRERAYELALHAVERHPGLRELVIHWVDDAMKFQATDMTLARELLNREKAGIPIEASDPLLSRLPAATRERINRAVDNERIAELQRRKR